MKGENRSALCLGKALKKSKGKGTVTGKWGGAEDVDGNEEGDGDECPARNGPGLISCVLAGVCRLPFADSRSRLAPGGQSLCPWAGMAWEMWGGEPLEVIEVWVLVTAYPCVRDEAARWQAENLGVDAAVAIKAQVAPARALHVESKIVG